MLQPVNSGFNSPTNVSSIMLSKSHSRIVSNCEDDSKTMMKEFAEWKDSILSKNPCMSNWTEKQLIKSRNMRQTSLCSKTFKDSEKCNSSRYMGEQQSIKQFDRKIFMTEENQKRKMADLNDNEPQLWSTVELETTKNLVLGFCDNYEKLCNWIVELKELQYDIHVDNSIFELCTQTTEISAIKRNVQEIDFVIEKHKQDSKAILKLLESLSSMILSKKRNIQLDNDSWQLIQSLFGDKILVEMLKHINSKSQSKTLRRNASKLRYKNYK